MGSRDYTLYFLGNPASNNKERNTTMKWRVTAPNDLGLQPILFHRIVKTFGTKSTYTLTVRHPLNPDRPITLTLEGLDAVARDVERNPVSKESSEL